MNVQLARQYDPAKNYKVASWFATPKLDGVRAVFIPEHGFFTRTNKPINGLDSIAEVLEEECRNRGLSFVDGELIASGGSFQVSQSVILGSDHAGKSSIEYHVFAVGGDFRNTEDMLKAIPHTPEARIFRVKSEAIPNTFEAVEETCRKFTAQGYEGVVLRHPEVAYFEGRSNHLLKYKFFKEADLKIIGVIEGEGRLAGTLGSLVVEGEVEGKRVRSCVGTGLTDEDRKILYEDAHLIGKIVTVKYQAITERPDIEGNYSLRFPSFMGVKEDRDFCLPEPTASIRQGRTENLSGQPNVACKNNGIVEAGFQVVFVKKAKCGMPCIPSEEMADWAQKLFQCRSVDEGIRLIANLKLTITEIRAFAEYLGVRLRGCKYLKAEIVRWLINASLGAKFRAETLYKILRERKRSNMAFISVNVATSEATDNKESTGSYEVKIFAGLDELPDAVFADALKRIRATLQSIPPEKHYPRFRIAANAGA